MDSQGGTAAILTYMRNGEPKVTAAPSRSLGIFVRCDTMGHGLVGLS